MFLVRKYNAHILFWNGIFVANYMTVARFAIFFLTLDRCLAIKFSAHLKYRSQQIRNFCCGLSIFIMLFIYSTNTAVFIFELPLKADSSKI